MKKFLAGFFVAILLPVVVFTGVLVFNSQIRHAVFRIAGEAPGVATYFIIRKHVISRDFENAVRWLNRELDLLTWTFPGQSLLLPKLVENTEYVMNQIYFPEEYAVLRPFLKRLVDAQPNLLPARIWYAQTLKDTDTDILFEQLDAAWRLASADERSYRLAMYVAIKRGLHKKLDIWCSRYSRGQFGGPRPYDYNTLFQGLGIRKLSLEVVDVDGSRIFLPNNGIQLGKSRNYEFVLPRPMTIAGLRLFIGVVPGISVSFGNMHFFRAGREKVISASAVPMTGRQGFYIDVSRLLITGRDGEVVTFHPQDGDFGKADKIILDLSFDRLSLASKACPKKDDLR